MNATLVREGTTVDMSQERMLPERIKMHGNMYRIHHGAIAVTGADQVYRLWDEVCAAVIRALGYIQVEGKWSDKEAYTITVFVSNKVGALAFGPSYDLFDWESSDHEGINSSVLPDNCFAITYAKVQE